MQGDRIAAHYDGARLVSATDEQPYLVGGVGLELWTHAAGYVMSADNVRLTALGSDVSVAAVGIAPGPGSGQITVTFEGAAGVVYLVQATTDFTAPGSWVSVSTNTAGTDGRWSFTDSSPILARRYYRATRP